MLLMLACRGVLSEEIRGFQSLHAPTSGDDASEASRAGAKRAKVHGASLQVVGSSS